MVHKHPNCRAIGWVDDYRKVVRKDTKGLIARWKYFWQSLAALAVGIYLYASAGSEAQTMLVLPFFKNFMPDLGLLFRQALSARMTLSVPPDVSRAALPCGASSNSSAHCCRSCWICAMPGGCGRPG